MRTALADQAIALLQKCVDEDDEENGHMNADNVLCDVLIKLGYKEVVDKWHEVDKWYS